MDLVAAKRAAAQNNIARNARATARRNAAARLRAARAAAGEPAPPAENDLWVEDAMIEPQDDAPDPAHPPLPRPWAGRVRPAVPRVPLGVHRLPDYQSLAQELPDVDRDGNPSTEWHKLRDDMKEFVQGNPSPTETAMMKQALAKAVQVRNLSRRVAMPANYEEIADLYADTDSAKALLDSLYPSSVDDYTSPTSIRVWERAVIFYAGQNPSSRNRGTDNRNQAQRVLLPNVAHVMQDFGPGGSGWPTWIADPTSPDTGGHIDPNTSPQVLQHAMVVVQTQRTMRRYTTTGNALHAAVATKMALPTYRFQPFTQEDITGVHYDPPGS